MRSSDTSASIRDAIGEAQSIVEGIQDPELRAVAFGRVLDYLLVSESLVRSPGVIEVRKGPSRPVKGAPLSLRPGPSAWVGSLLHEGFFSKPKTLSEVTESVRAQGHNIESKNVTDPLEKLVRSKLLRRERGPGEGTKHGVWRYSNY